MGKRGEMGDDVGKRGRHVENFVRGTMLLWSYRSFLDIHPSLSRSQTDLYEFRFELY